MDRIDCAADCAGRIDCVDWVDTFFDVFYLYGSMLLATAKDGKHSAKYGKHSDLVESVQVIWKNDDYDACCVRAQYEEETGSFNSNLKYNA